MTRIVLASLFSALLLISCADYASGPFHPRDDDDDNRPDTTDTTTHPPTDTSVCFTRDVLPILLSNCTMAECHDSYRPEEGIDLTSYVTIMNGGKSIVKPGNPGGSKLYESLVTSESEERMPPPPRSLTQAQIDLIAKWIREGATNRDCSKDSTSCDTTNVLYTAQVVPLMALHCTGCHGGSSPQAGIDLSVRSKVELYARNGKLLGTMSHSAGFIAMPPSGPRVNDCAINTIKAWISQGLR
ncbi:MAG: hypothetical protein NTX15_07135 [Candidatus Kapabacteria bacterium]|nr:hypothetical protein [Candidatus Kapabacteria bacterium]